MKKKVVIQGYSPDQDPTTPGVLTNCMSLVPSLKGMKGAPAPVTGTQPALAARCQGAATLKKIDGTIRTFAGTNVALFEDASTSWTDVSRGSPYTLATDGRWRFAQVGNVSLAVNKGDVLQFSSSGAFADLTAPKASIVEVVNQFVFLFDTNEATYNDSLDRWWCSALGDHTSWVPSVTTQSATGRLTSVPGRITAGRKFGDGLVVYKTRGMWQGTYIGAPSVWNFTEIPGNIGALSQEVVVNVGTPEDPRHIFMGFEDFYTYDGSNPKPIGSPSIKETVYGELNQAVAGVSMALHDSSNSRIYFFYPSSGTTSPDKAVVYNYKTGKWGRDDRSVEAVLEYITGGVTYAGLGSLYTTYNDLPNVSYDSPFLSSGAAVPAIFNTSHVMQKLTGASVASSMTTGDFGDDSNFLTFQRFRPRFITAPQDGSMTNYYKDNEGVSLTQDQTTAYSNGKFDTLRSSRWHRALVTFKGPVEVAGWEVEFQEDGDE